MTRLQGIATCFEFRNVSFGWPGGRTVLRDQSFSLPAGRLIVVRGPSGAGKSTLLRLMNRLEESQSGVIRYRGRDLCDYDAPRLRQQVAYVQQMPVVPDVSVRETLLMPFGFGVNKGLTPPEDDELTARLDEVCLGGVGLNEHAAALSGGQQQRLCLVRALMTQPDVLLLDEPTASLDNESRTVVEQMAEQRCASGVTVIMVTHEGFLPRHMPMVEIRLRDGKVEVGQ